MVLGGALAFQLAMIQTQFAQQQPQAAPGGGQAAGAPQAGRGGGGQRGATDPRVQQRTYLFKDTEEQLPYALFVSSKVSKDKKNPLIVALHGLGGNQNTMVNTSYKALDMAEEGGFIYVAPMGYNSGGWYGIPGGRGGRGAGAPGAPGAGPGRGAPAAPGNGFAAQAQQAPAGGGAPGAGRGAIPGLGGGGAGRGGAPGGGRGGFGGIGGGGGGTAVTDDAKVRELSEKDVMNVLEMMRKEFNVDERRIYVMGHSMGGSGTLHLASKYPEIWAAAAAIAPPGAGGAGVAESLGKSKLPALVVQGDMDTAVPVAGTRTFIDRLKGQNAVYEYIEIAGGDHGNVIGIGMPDIFKWFGKHTKPAK
jgi:predicted esterase